VNSLKLLSVLNAICILSFSTSVNLTAHTTRLESLFRLLGPSIDLPRTIDDLSVLRSSRIELDPLNFDPNSDAVLRPESRLSFNLFGERKLTVRISETTQARNGSLTVVGDVEGHPASLVVISSVDGAVNGIITVPTLGRFQIQYTSLGRQRLNELDPSIRPQCGNGLEAHQLIEQSKWGWNDGRSETPSGLRKLTTHESEFGKEEHEEIDILFLYTASTSDGAGGEAGVHSLIDLAMAEANAIFENNHLPLRVRLAHSEMTEYRDSGSIATDIDDLINHRGPLSNVESLRLQFGADLVTLIVETDSNGWAGVARIPRSIRGDRTQFGNVLSRKWIGTGFYLYVHEMAHNLGCQHDRRNAKNTNGVLSPGVFPYSLGYRFEAEDITHVTVMGYQPGIVLPFFSDPTTSYNGIPLGKVAGVPDEADNVASLRKMAPLVAGYQNLSSRYQFDSPVYDANEIDEHLTLTIHRHGDLSADSFVGVRSTSGTATSGSDFVELKERIQFTAGNFSQAFKLKLLPDELLEGNETFRIALEETSPSAGFATPSITEVTIVDDDWKLSFPQSHFTVFEKAQTVQIPVRYNGDLSPEESFAFPYQIERSEDFSVQSGEVVFRNGTFTSVIEFLFSDDTVPEPDEMLTVQVGPSRATIRILDDDRSGSLDPEFTFNIAALDGPTWRLKLQGGDRLLFGGDFGQDPIEPAPSIGVSDRAGQPVPNFSSPKVLSQQVPSGARNQPYVFPLEVTQDGKILVGGIFAIIADQVQPNLARLHADGSFDESFRPVVDGIVSTVKELPDGRILIGGRFENVNGVRRFYLARLLPDGTNDPNFQPGHGIGAFSGRVSALAIQADGHIIIGGRFDTISGVQRGNLARLKPDGSLDETFNTPMGVNGPIAQVHLVPDGRIYISGEFTSVAGRTTRKIARLLPSGLLDLTFDTKNAFRRNTTGIVPLRDGRVFVAGEFLSVGDTSRGRIVLLNADGSLDPSFDPGLGADDVINSLALHRDGWLYVGGLFQHFNGIPSPYLARLKTDFYEPKILSLGHEIDTIHIQLGGTEGTLFKLETSPDLDRWKSQGDYQFNSKQITIKIPILEHEPTRFFRLTTPYGGARLQ
jgi:uncharacterized delta-60 repeat protein